METITLQPANLLDAWGIEPKTTRKSARKLENDETSSHVSPVETAKPQAATVSEGKTATMSSERDIDQELVLRVQRGDKKAFELLVTKYHRKIGRLLSRMIRDQAEIEDVTQEAFIKAYRALPAFRGESAFYTWLYRIAINTAKNYLASLGRRPVLSTEYEDEDGDTLDTASQLPDMNTPETELMNRQIVTTVNQAVEALPEELRTAITLREMEGLSYEDIAAVMNCPIGTVRSRIFRAREAIATRLRPMIESAGKDRRW
ncbi:RNA polymerase sigma factor RpoE [Chitinimonas naiadis]